MIAKAIIGKINNATVDFWNDPNLLAHKFKKENLYGPIFPSHIFFIYFLSRTSLVNNSFLDTCTPILFDAYLYTDY